MAPERQLILDFTETRDIMAMELESTGQYANHLLQTDHYVSTSSFNIYMPDVQLMVSKQ